MADKLPPLACSLGGVPFNKAHLDAKDDTIRTLRKRVAALQEELRGTPCPRPCNGRPDDLTAGACIDYGECGCCVGATLADPSHPAGVANG